MTHFGTFLPPGPGPTGAPTTPTLRGAANLLSLFGAACFVGGCDSTPPPDSAPARAAVSAVSRAAPSSGAAPKLYVEPTTVGPSGELSAVKRVLLRRHSDVRRCWEPLLRDSPETTGQVRVAFTLTASGAAEAVRIASSTLDTELPDRCLVELVRRTRFPAPRAGGKLEVTYPFELEATSR